MKKQFMVEFEMPEEFTDDFVQHIPRQRKFINYLLADGKLQSYSLALDRSVLWAIFLADSEFEVMEMIEQMPIAEHVTPYISELMFHNSSEQVLSFSLN